MKLSITQNQFFDDAGRPLSSGTVSIYYHGSDTLATVYYLEGDDYVDAPNPLTCSEDGRIPTVFFDATVVDVVVKDALGQVMDTFQTGFYVDDARNATAAEGIAALKQADPSLGFVNVVGYDQYVNAPYRTYVWDANCPSTPDNGVVVESTVAGAVGAWVLLWEWRELPVSIYGVKPGIEANISAAIGYAQSVGTFGLRTPPVVRFPGGTYGSNTTYATSKVLSFDTDAKFTNATFSAPAIEVTAQQTSYVADFVLTKKQARVESSWFRTAQAFFKCGAAELHQSATNYFTSTAMDTSFTISGARISGAPVTLTGSGWYMALDGCDIAPRSLSTAWALKFLNSTFREDWFGSGSFDFVNNTVVHTTDQNSIRLENFRNVGNYIKCIEADGQTDVDLSGRHVGTISTSVLRTFRNVSCDTLNVTATGANVEFHNVSCQNVNISGFNLTVHDSAIKFWTEPTLNGLFCYYSDVASQYAVTGMTMACTFENCRVGMSFSRGSDNTTRDGALTFRECTFYTNEAISSKNISMYGCVTDNANIKVYPYHDGSNYRIFARFVGNTFVNTNAVEFTKAAQDDCYECIADWTIVDNSFTGNDDGIKCRYWSNRTGSYFDKVFIMPDNRSSIFYGGNSGKCPAENMKGAGIAAGDTPLRTVDIGSGNNLYAYNRKKRCCPKFSVADTATATQKLYQMAAASNDTHAVIVDNQNSQNMRSLNGLYYWAYDNVWNDRDGDLFQLGLCIWVTQLDSHWGVSVL